MTTMRDPDLAALVLAGGASRRMGRDKAALEFDGRAQLDRAVALLEPLVAPVYVSQRAEQADNALRAKYRQLIDRYTDIGPLAGILTALESGLAQRWLVLACDLPLLDSATVIHLLAHIDQSQIATAYRSTHDSLPEPLCAVWELAAIEPIRTAIAADIHCPRKILIHNDASLLEQPVAGALENVNTPEDLERVAALNRP